MDTVVSTASDLLDAALATAEFLVVDTETNGLAGERCEVTEIGAVLVGGGELHERWETLVPVRAPLSRGIQRFTGVTQAMVDEAPPAEMTLPELAEQLDGRVLVAHNAAFDRRVLAQAFGRAGVAWPDPPVLCTVALARRLHPLARQRKLRAAGRVAGHRRRGDAPRAGRRRDLRARALRAVSAAVRQRGDGGSGVGAAGGQAAQDVAWRPDRRRRVDARRPAPEGRLLGAAATSPASTSSATRRASRCTSASRWTSGRAPRRTSGRRRRTRAGSRRSRWSTRSRRNSEVGALLHRASADQAAAPAGQRAPQARRPLGLPALPAGHRVPDPRGRARAGAGAGGQRRAAARTLRGGRAGRAAARRCSLCVTADAG